MTKQEKAAVVSITTNIVLTVVKFVLASITASIALLAEAYHSFADIFSSLAVLLALRADQNDISVPEEAQPPDEAEKEGAAPISKPRFFAPGNWGNKVAMGIGFLLIFAAINIFGKVSQAGTIMVRYPLLAAIIVSFLGLCSYLLYRFETSVGKSTGSAALIADGRHAQTDMLASALVVVALVATRLGSNLDKLAAAIIGAYILISAIHLLVQSIWSYIAAVREHEFSREIIYEDILFLLVYRIVLAADKTFWDRIGRLPGLKGSPETIKTRFALTLAGLALVVGSLAYACSGLYILGPGDQAIVERFGRPLQKDSPVGPGLHYHWPWPVERVKRADTGAVRRLTVGYKTGDQKYLILWTNKHYLREYSIITGEGPFLDVAMNVHYRIGDLYLYLFGAANPDKMVEKIAYQVLRETLGTRSFFSSITADRDALEELILSEIQQRADTLALGIVIQNICFRDLHPPSQVAAAFEDVVSAQEDYETYIEEAYGYRKDKLPQARALAATTVNDAEAYRNALIAQSAGKAQAFALQQQAYAKSERVTRTRMILETVEDSLANVPKYIINPDNGAQRPDLWLSLPPFVQISIPKDATQTKQADKLRVREKFRINSEEDLIDALERFQQKRTGTEK